MTMRRAKKKKLSGSEILRYDRMMLLTTCHDFNITEAYKSLRTNVMFSCDDDNKCPVIMVTSSMPGEGKSTVSSNLAISLAETGKKTLLIDCDLRKPKISRLFKAGSCKGLSNALLDSNDLNSSLIKVKDMNLFIMTAGSLTSNPSEMLGSKRMATLLKLLRTKFEYIVLDTPPVNVVTDAIALSPVSDGTLLVLRSDVTERNSALRALTQLKMANVNVLGVVLNNVDEQNSYYGRQHKGAYYGNYGYSTYNSATDEYAGREK